MSAASITPVIGGSSFGPSATIEKTVAETNPEYDSEERVVLVGYEKLLKEYWLE